MENIRIENLTVEFENSETGTKSTALKNINLSLSEGEFVCIIGENGSGKSTLAKTLNGLIEQTSGDIYIYGMNTKNEKDILDIRKNIGMAFQNPDNQIVASVVEEDIAFGMENIGIDSDTMKERIDNVLTTLNIQDLRYKLTHKLSGGQKQKVSIAGILAMQSKIIVLDEPTSMIDKKGRTELLDLVKKLSLENNLTIILISHYIEEITYADRVILLNDGEIVDIDTPKNILMNLENYDNVKIDLPYIAKLASSFKNKYKNLIGNETNLDEFFDKLKL